MALNIPKYTEPDFNQDFLMNAPNATLIEVEIEGVSPANYHALSVFPEYFKINNKWVLAIESRMDTVCVARDEVGKESVDIVEFRNLKKGDKVVVGRTEDGSDGIYMYTQGFVEKSESADTFAFRSGRSRETAFSVDYDTLYDILRHEKEKNGYVTWVLGAAVSLDIEARAAMEKLVREGYVDAIICGTGLAAYDLEQAYFGTTLGQTKYVKEQNTYQNYFETINMVREAGTIEEFIAQNDIKDGIIKACVDCKVPFVLASTIRDKFTLPGTYDNVYEAQNAMRKHTRKTSSIIMVSTILFTIATGNMTPSYNEFDGVVRPVYMYTVDIQEFAVNKLADRGTLTAKSVVTNTQDFLKNIARAIC